jgi:hypothetical protein
VVGVSDQATASHICWHASGRDSCPDFPHNDALLFQYGRCRSGKRWFWSAQCWSWRLDEELEAHGWADTEGQAVTDARAAVERLADGRPARAYVCQGVASSALKRVNADRLRARPSPGTSDARPVEYLYGHSSCDYSSLCPCSELTGRERWDYHIVPYRITRKTAKRIYYVRGQRTLDEPEIGYVDRQKLEADGKVYRRSGHWWDDDFPVYARPPEPPDEPAGPAMADVSRLRAEMADAHPDRGGDRDSFMAARERYLAAKGRTGATS